MKRRKNNPKSVFQFPTNGKAYPKVKVGDSNEIVLTFSEFQFPTNGKAYPKVIREGERQSEAFEFSFNSLRTGKPIQRRNLTPHLLNVVDVVSIPYERESLSKEAFYRTSGGLNFGFQFPTNGKAYPKN